MVIVPMRSHYEVGSDITMTCSADSSPAAIVQWMVDGMYLNHSGPQLQLEMVTESHSGNYKCVVRNTVTSRFSSQSALIRILGKVGRNCDCDFVVCAYLLSHSKLDERTLATAAR